MLDSKQKQELHELVDAACDETLTIPQAARLEKIVLESDEACRYYRDRLKLHGSLCLLFDEDRVAPFPAEGRAAGGVSIPSLCASPASGREASLPAGPLRALFVGSWGVVAAATVVVLLIAVWFRTPSVPAPAHRPTAAQQPAPAVEIARLARTIDAAWAEDANAVPGQKSPAENADRLVQGQRLDLRSGMAEIVFHNGARVVLEGPATFTIESPGSGRLDTGKLVAHVPHEARGFIVHTPKTSVVDQGTEFGVQIGTAGREEVQVFRGQVDLRLARSDAGSAPREIRQGEAVRIEAAKNTVEPMLAVEATFAAARAMLHTRLLFNDNFDNGDLAHCGAVAGFVQMPRYWHPEGRIRKSGGTAIEADGGATISTSGTVWKEFESIMSIDSFPAAGSTFTFVLNGSHPPSRDCEIRLVNSDHLTGGYHCLSLVVESRGFASLTMLRGNEPKGPYGAVVPLIKRLHFAWDPHKGPLEVRLQVDSQGYEVRLIPSASAAQSTGVERGNWPHKGPLGLSDFIDPSARVFLQVGCHTGRLGGVESVTFKRISVEAPEL